MVETAGSRGLDRSVRDQAMTCWPGCRRSSICTPSPSKTPASRTSIPSWSNMARRSSSLHERPRSSTSASPSAKPTSSWGVAMW